MVRLCRSLIGCIVLWTVTACSAGSSPRDPWHANPADVRFLNQDVARFWQAYDRLSAETDGTARAATLQQDYFDGGSAGLASYARDFRVTPSSLLAAIDRYATYYQHVRPPSLTIPDATDEQRMRAVLENLERLYPKAHYPDVYFVIGDTQTAGTVTSEGLVLGTETLAKDPEDQESAPPRHLVDLGYSRDQLPVVVAHEIAHAQQKYYPGRQTVLFWIILEGVAELVGSLLTGAPASAALHDYGNAHEAELWTEFQASKDDLGKGTWFSPATGDRPGSIGYYLGYQIVKSYYDRQTAPQAAVDSILNIEDFERFLQDSGYASRFEFEESDHRFWLGVSADHRAEEAHPVCR